MPQYYKILDKNLVGRQDGMFDCSIFYPEQGWVWDRERILMDRIIGYDEDTIGSSDMLSRIEKITEEEAMKLIQKTT